MEKDWKEEIIQQIKDCGQSLIDNAENIVTDYKFPSEFIITCYVGNENEAPYINVDIKFYPETFMRR